MKRETMKDFLSTNFKHRYEVANISKETFCKLFNKAHEGDMGEKWWEEFVNLSIEDKIMFFVDDDELGTIFDAYCIGFSDGLDAAY